MNEDDRRKTILSVAEKIFSQKGSRNTTISEIANKADTTDFLIYQYFKNKEGLLFSIPYVHMQNVLTKLTEHFQGIQNIESKLSKMIWFHLSNQDAYPDYARVLLLECRSRKQFYKTSAYNLIKYYSVILSDILSQGVRENIFRDDVDVYLMRDLILGTLDWETITSLVAGETEKIVTDLDEILSLIFAAIKSREKKNLNKRERILQVAEVMFAEKGFDGTRILEIAENAKVSEGIIYEYFESKKQLLLSIPALHFLKHSSLIYHAFEIKKPNAKLNRFIHEMFNIFFADRNFLKLFLFEIQFHRSFFKSKAYDDFKTYFKVIEEIIEEGKKSGDFRQNVNSRVFRNMLIGTFAHIALRWNIVNNKKRKNDIMNEIEQVTKLLSTAVSKQY